MKRIGLALPTLILAACTSIMPRPRPAEEAFGPPPTNAEAKAREFMERTLKDPESGRYRFGKLTRAYGAYGVWNATTPWSGYLLPVEVNAKNSFGGYVGFKPYVVFFHMGEPLRSLPADSVSWLPY